MKRVKGNAEIKLLECTNVVRNRWRMRWDVQPDDDGAIYMEAELAGKPTVEDIERIISSSGVDALDSELQTIGELAGYDREKFIGQYNLCRNNRIASDPQAQLTEMMRVRNLAEATAMTDEQALRVPQMFFSFSDVCRRGTEVEKDTVLRYKNKLWRVVQTHTPSDVFPPSIETASLYTRIDKKHAGTADDPIPYEQGMAFEEGKHYEQYGTVYLCIQTTLTGFPNDLRDLPTIVKPL